MILARLWENSCARLVSTIWTTVGASVKIALITKVTIEVNK